MTAPWHLNASDYGVTTTGDSTTAAQSCLDAAHTGNIGTVIFPTGFNFTKLATYPGIRIIGGGPNNPWKRTAVGPGLYVTDAPGNAYPSSICWNVALQDVTIDGGGLDGTNILMDSVQSWRMERVESKNAGSTGAVFTGWISGTQLTVGTVNRGALAVGMMIVGAGCAISGNTYPTIVSGSGSTWTLSASLTVTSETMAAVPTWSWTDGGGARTLPSACVSFLGSQAIVGVYDGIWTAGYAGGSFSGGESGIGTCSPVGIYCDSTSTDGGGKFNANTIDRVYTPCNLIGLWCANGADNTFRGLDFEYDSIGVLMGTGPGNATRNRIEQCYFEGLSSSPMAVGAILDALAIGTEIAGFASQSYVTQMIQDVSATARVRDLRWCPTDGSGAGLTVSGMLTFTLERGFITLDGTLSLPSNSSSAAVLLTGMGALGLGVPARGGLADGGISQNGAGSDLGVYLVGGTDHLVIVNLPAETNVLNSAIGGRQLTFGVRIPIN